MKPNPPPILYIIARTGTGVRSPNKNELPEHLSDEEMFVVPLAAYDALLKITQEQEEKLKLNRSNMRCGNCGEASLWNRGIELQAELEELSKEVLKQIKGECICHETNARNCPRHQ